MTQGKKRYISTKFRDDKFVVELDPIEKLLFMYFLTNPLTNVAGIYEISLRRIAFDTGIDKDMVQKIINRLTESKKVYYIDGYIILANSNKHQNMENAKIKKGIENVLSGLSKDLIDKIGPIYDSSMTYIGLSNNLDLDLDLDSDLDSDLDLEETTPIGVPEKKKSIINKNNKQGAVEIYDKIKEMCIVVDGSLNDCVVLRSKLEKYGGDPVNLLEIMITKMRDTGLSKFYSISSPGKLADNLGTIVEKLKAETEKEKSKRRVF